MKNNFSKNLKHYRKAADMKQETLARKLHMTRQSVSYLENNRRQCDLDTLIEIADVFEITLDELIR